MSEVRMSRETELRDAAKRPTTWKPPQLLPEPDPRPGYVHKYIRVAVQGQPDPANTSAMLREGWEPCKSSEYPELLHQADQTPNSRFKDCIEIGGLLLCRAPEELMNQRKEYYAKMNQAQLEGVDNNFLREQDNRSNMAVFRERKSSVSFGRGNKS